MTVTRTLSLCLGLGACLAWACSSEFRAGNQANGGASSHVGDGGESDGPTSSGDGGGETNPSPGSGGEGGELSEPGGGSAGSSPGGSGGNPRGGSAGNDPGGSAGSAGSGGMSPDEEGCRVPVGQVPVMLETFSTDVFADPLWSRSNLSVVIDGQQLLISQNEGFDDYADLQLADNQLPLVVQVRAVMMTNGQAHKWPVLDLLPADVSAGRVTITFQDGVNAGWQFTQQDDFTGSVINAPKPANFTTVRAFIAATGGVLCAKTDAQSGFVKVASASWSFAAVHKLRLRQAYDEICRFDDLTLYRY